MVELQRWEKGLAFAAAAGLVATMYAALLWAPTEATMGDIQRIFYVHVPSAWTAFLAFFFVFLAGIAYLVTKNLKWDRIALACAEIGTIFCTVVLITGPIWAKPVWGIWWTWDARLTSTLILWLMYVSYLLLRDFLDEPARRATLSAVFGIFAFVDVPVVYVSIRLWRTQHPQPVLGGGEESGLDPQMFQVLMLSWVAFLILFVLLVLLRVRLEKARDEVRQLRRELMLS
ncbi:MAG: cytochrome C assembly protein [Acidobacteria bacterium RIFCSPLOWO2_02_FULL_61_28]|nr:MAG: cytochrome C assembly protein [Acidobacteria bacterium RIFCSPLOWO2_02_FULL_61_28]